MKFCPTCGIKRIENANFCYECGYKFPFPLQERDTSKTSVNPDLSQKATNLHPFREMDEWEEGWDKLTHCLSNCKEVSQSSVTIVFDGQIKRNTKAGKVASSIYTYFDNDYTAVTKFVLSYLHPDRKTDPYSPSVENYSLNKRSKHYMNQNKSNNEFLEVAEMVIDYSSPRSAIKRIINNLKK